MESRPSIRAAEHFDYDLCQERAYKMTKTMGDIVDRILSRLGLWSTGRWAIAGIIICIGTGSTVGVLTRALGGTRWVAGAIGGLGVVVAAWGVLLVLLQLRQRKRGEELRALINVRPLIGKRPVDLGGWAADPVLADELVRTACRRRPGRIVECGSGWTTALLAACLNELGEGEIVALEHDDGFAQQTRELLAASGGTSRGQVLLAPLTPQRNTKQLWYDREVANSIDGPIDLLIVDGPPAQVATQARYPAVPLFEDRLGDDCIVFLDDGFRDDETEIADAWGKRLGVVPTLEARGGGFWILDLADGD